ncbi:hypothetical protein KDL29_10910 [bacterium]|nr:hypothetical protein [bacterium]
MNPEYQNWMIIFGVLCLTGAVATAIGVSNASRKLRVIWAVAMIAIFVATGYWVLIGK